MSEVVVGPVLSFEGVSVRYRGASAVEEVSLSVARGSVFALLGRTCSSR